MRDIKFRAINSYTKDWCYGSLVKYYEDYHIQEPEQYEFMDIIEETIGQYTGLKDKNGKEIYEGDIVLDYKTKYIVRYEPLRGGFFPFACGDGCGCCDDEVVYNSKDVKIIGNIYDNPELVKEIENQKNI